MGDGKKLQAIKSGKMTDKERNWKTIETKIVKGKKVSVIKAKKENESAKMPRYSDTSDIYIVLDKDNKPKQMAIYNTETHQRAKDFDWNRHNEDYTEGVLHVHIFDKDGNRIFKEPTELEKRYFKTIIREFNYDFSKIRYDKNNT